MQSDDSVVIKTRSYCGASISFKLSLQKSPSHESDEFTATAIEVYTPFNADIFCSPRASPKEI